MKALITSLIFMLSLLGMQGSVMAQDTATANEAQNQEQTAEKKKKMDEEEPECE